MSNKLERLRKYTTVVADTGDIDSIAVFQPEDATTNPSLILKAAQVKKYSYLIHEAVSYSKSKSKNKKQQLVDACDRLAVNFGKEILDVVPGRISTEVDARLSYDFAGSLDKARKLVSMYSEVGIPRDRILIKLAATWEGIRAAEVLEKEGVNCNLTLLFSFAQARACAEAGVFLVSPFVGRILDWYKTKTGTDYAPADDPGVQSVTSIYNYYKRYGYKTIVMGASFRNVGEVIELAGCDRLTISPQLLQILTEEDGEVVPKLHADIQRDDPPVPMSQTEFLWQHNQDAMAVEKLAEGIRNFAIDQEKLESMLDEYF